MRVGVAALCLLSACGGSGTYGAGQCGAAPDGWFDPRTERPHLSVGNEIRLDAEGGLRWNGQPRTEEGVGEYLAISARMAPQPAVVLVVDNDAECGDVRRIRSVMAGTAICDAGLCGEVSDSSNARINQEMRGNQLELVQ
ncbi:ExbD/TolR family protein [Stakelama tenebrarum]|uniref:Uncharacterized protein n=1 Tax=Stakelama tenebrarum TaxID=2711215 RepID=A0A6G6Y9W9_9SPHN|nr:hypothetical protein [Sphingosinithalassobacter tenebrarum]QIG81607.1 hypothetical protein G5C33_18645 [Sphingosinithalassobacter tenebrarum]